MDYKAFFAEVVDWINQANQQAMKHGIESEDFWAWVTASAAALCEKYENKSLTLKQMIMLTEWLEDAYKSKVGKD